MTNPTATSNARGYSEGGSPAQGASGGLRLIVRASAPARNRALPPVQALGRRRWPINRRQFTPLISGARRRDGHVPQRRRAGPTTAPEAKTRCMCEHREIEPSGGSRLASRASAGRAKATASAGHSHSRTLGHACIKLIAVISQSNLAMHLNHCKVRSHRGEPRSPRRR